MRLSFLTVFSLFNFKFLQPAIAIDPGPRVVNRMTFEERKAWRREMLYQSIRESLLSMELSANLCKVQVMPVDERHHRFIAMLEVNQTYFCGEPIRPEILAALEKRMRSNSYDQFGILITATFWRFSDGASTARKQSRSTDVLGADSARQVQARRQPSVDAAVQTGTAYRAVARQPVISLEESAALVQALRNGAQEPGDDLGVLVYDTDLTPLDEGIMIGGTQYGKLQ